STCARAVSTATVSTRLPSNPSGRVARLTNVRTSSPAVSTSTSESATCATTSPPARRAVEPDDVRRPSAFSASIASPRAARRARAPAARTGPGRSGGPPPVDRRVEHDVANRVRELRDHDARAPGGEHQSHDRAAGGDDRALDEQLARQLPPRGAEREPDAQIV